MECPITEVSRVDVIVAIENFRLVGFHRTHRSGLILEEKSLEEFETLVLGKCNNSAQRRLVLEVLSRVANNLFYFAGLSSILEFVATDY